MKSSNRLYESLEDNDRDKRRGTPAPPPPPPHDDGCCCWLMSCIGCCLCLMLLLVVILMAAIAIMYFIYSPQIPLYGIDSLQVKAFEMRKNDTMIFTEISVVVRCENPNKNIGFKYEDNSISIIYSDAQLCAGKFEPFLQKGKNTAMINMTLKGERELDSKEKEQLLAQKKEGKIPLELISKIPIRPVMGENIQLWDIKVRANCSMVVDNIEKDKTPIISDKQCTFGADF
ncbi:hypothetical protein PIB30_001102 [Stylosanthes scabra]|uniref:Late embryogenesis abundant protein LEA-2 subgroup domain-containing protein n=1 Tax=Stylosanthes scabra TaxID=79078 RepID=A0ABU6U2T6_9FABA|nr:hypothetical protein [Stylosanthes scabra]